MSYCYIVNKSHNLGEIRKVELVKETAKTVLVKCLYAPEREDRMIKDGTYSTVAMNESDAKHLASERIARKIKECENEIFRLDNIEVLVK